MLGSVLWLFLHLVGGPTTLAEMTSSQDDDKYQGADAYVPHWDGNPASWHTYKDEVRIWTLGLNLDVPYSLAARMIRKLKGAARRKALTLTNE
eukprot:4828503-Pyramimonas_sp.AAC.1